MVRFAILIVLIYWGLLRLSGYSNDGLLHVVFCDVGQGDATLIRHKSVQVLIDGGKDDSVLQCLEQHMPPWDKTLEVVVATHPDADHINGLVQVLDNYQVNTLLHNGQTKQTADFGRFKDAVQNEVLQGGEVVQAHKGMKIIINNKIDVSILYPFFNESKVDRLITTESETLLSDVLDTNEQTNINHNDSSVVLKIQHKKIDMLLMGDLEEGGEEALVEAGLIAEVEVLKVGHHGSKTSSTPEFIRLSRPEISVISAGKNNSYGHPHPLVLERLYQVESLVLRTDQDTSIELVSDGRYLWRRRTDF